MSTVRFCLVICTLISVSWAYPRLKRQAFAAANKTLGLPLGLPPGRLSLGRLSLGRPCPATWSARLSVASLAVTAFDPSKETIFTCDCKPSFQCLSGMRGGGIFGILSEQMTGATTSLEVFPIQGTCPPGNTCCCSDMQETAMDHAATSDTAAMMSKLFQMRAMGGMGARPGTQSLMNNPILLSTLIK